MTLIPAVAAEQLGCFTTWQALPVGSRTDTLERAVSSTRLTRVRAGVYQAPDPSQDLWTRRRTALAAQAVAATLTTPGTRVSGGAACILYDLSLLRIPRLPCVSVERWLTGSVPGTHLHRCPPSAVVRFGEVTCDGVPRAIADVAREGGVTAGVVTLDHALRTGLTDLDEMRAELSRMRGWPGSRRAQRAVDLADGLSESVLESRSRLAMEQHELPVPELQVNLANAWGGFAARVDFYWDEFGVVGEVDGAVKYSGDDPDALSREKERQERLEDLGLIVVRWNKSGVDVFEPTADRLRRAFARAGRRSHADRLWTVLPRLDLPIRDS